jgi:tetratricopeptide (TPR) repeat protein
MWRSRPIFISSTFADMQAERDYLRSRVFPELEERLAGRRHNLEWVDLRVGVATASQTDEHVRELYVLKVCLDEVRRCRPFLIVLLGDRYGWVPPEERIKAAAEEARQGFSADVAGRSVTDLEIEFGVLSDPEQQPRSFFYFREPLPYAQMPAEIAALYSEDYAADDERAERKGRLEALKRRVGERLPGRVRHYAAAWDAEHQRAIGLEDFGRMVRDDIWAELDAETETAAAAADIPWQQAEREALEDFIDDRARDFVGRRDLLDSLTRLATGTDGPAWSACVTGEPGSGKSALFGALYRRLRGSDVFVLAHAAGASVAAPTVNTMLRRWVGELADALGIDPNLPDNADTDTIDVTFARLLGSMAQQRRVVVLVDALDQFETTIRGRYLTWLPRPWPANARLIATAIPGDGSQALAEREGRDAVALPPLDAAEARDIIAAICGRYHRAFELEVIEALLAKRGPNGPAWSQPLWLVLAVEDLNLLDADDFARAQRDYAGAPAERLRALMLDVVAGFPPGIAGLYAQGFERAEDLFGAGVARGFLGLIAVSRAGWRESDFRATWRRATGENWDELKFAELRRFFRGQMRQHGAFGQWDFRHAQMRLAVLSGIAARGVDTELHAALADHLLALPADDPLRLSEAMVHLLGSDDRVRAARFYGASPLAIGDEPADGATQVLADTLLRASAFNNAARLGQVLHVLDAACALRGDDADGIATNVAERMLFELDSSLRDRANLDVRLGILGEIGEAFRKLCGRDPQNPQWLRDLGFALEFHGEALIARGDLPAALGVLKESIAARERLAKDRPDDVGAEMNLAIVNDRISNVLMEQGDVGQALQAQQRKLAICERLVERGVKVVEVELAATHGAIGRLQMMLGNPGAALDSFKACQSLFAQLVQADPRNVTRLSDLATTHGNMAGSLVELGDLSGALASVETAYAIFRRLADADPQNVQWLLGLSSSLDQRSTMQRIGGDIPGAIESMQASLIIARRLADARPENAAWQRTLGISHMHLGQLLEDHNNIPAALQNYDSFRRIAERLVGLDPTNAQDARLAGIAHALIAGVLEVEGDLEGALDEYGRALALQEHCAALDPANAEALRDTAIANDKIGAIQDRLGNVAAARRSSERSLEIFARLMARNASDRRSRMLSVPARLRLAALDDDKAEAHLAAALDLLTSDPGIAGTEQGRSLIARIRNDLAAQRQDSDRKR